MVEINKWPISKRTVTALEKQSILSLDDLPDFLDDLKAIKGLGPNGVKEIREWVFQKFGLKFKTKPKVKKKILQDPKAAKEVVEHLLPPGPKNWGQQLKFADQLIQRYGKELLLKVDKNPKIYSLAWFLADYGADYIRKFMDKKVILEPAKVEEPEVPCELNIEGNKPKSLRDFLKL